MPHWWNSNILDTDNRISRIADTDQEIEVSVIQPNDGYGGSNVEFVVSTAAAGGVGGNSDRIHIHFAGPATAVDQTQWNSRVKVIKFKGATPRDDVNLYRHDDGDQPINLRGLSGECIGYPRIQQALQRLNAAWNTYRGVV